MGGGQKGRASTQGASQTDDEALVGAGGQPRECEGAAYTLGARGEVTG